MLDGPLPRSELARRLDLSAGSLTRLSKPLLDSGLLVETDGGYEAVSGRPTRPLDVDERPHHFVGVKLTADTAYAVLTTLRANVVAAEEALLPDRSPAAVIAAVAGLVRALPAGVDGVTLHDVRAVGVSLGGLVDPGGEVRNARYLGWTAVPLDEALERELGVPVVVDNDVLSLTRSEQWFGTARRCDHFAVLTIGEGVGYGLVVDDEVVDRPDAGIGLLGHYPLDPHGPLCPKGHAGCAEAMLTVGGVTARTATGLRRPVRYEEVLDVSVQVAGFPEWARGAAVTAIRTFVLGLRR